MTTELGHQNRPPQDADPVTNANRTGGRGSAEFSVFLSRLALFWERLWPALLAMAAPFFLIVIVALFGLWRFLPAWAHWLALIAAAMTSAFAGWRTLAARTWPTRREAQARLERDGGARHAPLQALDDQPFSNDSDHPLWRAHIEKMKERARAARLRGPRASADDIDPYALRFGALGLLAAALVAAGDERSVRFAEGFRPASQAGAGVLADLWIEPPDYTGKPPIYLYRAGGDLSGLHEQVNAPEGSTVIAQINGAARVKLTLKTPDEEFDGALDETGKAARATLNLMESGVLRLRIAGREGRWPIGIIPDEDPVVAFIEPPSTTDDARLALALSIADDYGVASAVLHLTLDPAQERPLDAPAIDENAIRETRIIALDGLAGANGERRFDLDLQSDPWAGLQVIGKLVVKDGAGQTAETGREIFRLPAKPFFNPLARAVIEQRQTLAVAADEWQRAGRSFEALTLAPEKFYPSATDYLLIRTAFWRVMRQSDNALAGEGFGETVEDFWPLALQLEDEALELARRRLQAAQDALRQALESGASDAEIERLTEDLREAMQQYLTALANSGQRSPSDGRPPDQRLDQSDLDKMLNSIRDLAKSGAQNAARQALSDLENILNNLRLSGQSGEGQQGQGSQGQSGEGQAGGQQSGGAAGQAGDLIGRQRDLANESFERGQSGGAGGGEPGDDLAARQGDLASDLSGLMETLEDQAGRGPSPDGANGDTLDPDGKAGRALGDALSEMRRAENALEGDDFAAANSAMERAIANLRDGAEALAEQQGRQAQEGEGEGRRAGPAFDPLGRPIGDAYGQGVDVPEQSDAQRAREVLEELRRRLSDGKRTEEEIDYLERLLDRF